MHPNLFEALFDFNVPDFKVPGVTAVNFTPLLPAVERIIFNDPATIIIWKDGSKTVVKAHGGDEFNPLTGVALCYMKKALGNSSRKFNDALHAAEAAARDE